MVMLFGGLGLRDDALWGLGLRGDALWGFRLTW